MSSVQTSTDDVYVQERAYEDEAFLVLDVGFVMDENVSVDFAGDMAIITKNGKTVAELTVTSRDVTVKTNNGVITIEQ